MSERVLAGAEPFSHQGGPVGVLMLHGFTGNPSSVRLVGEWLAERGHAIEGPRLPGHGTHWQDLGRHAWTDWVAEAERSLDDLAARSETVIAFGQSMGGAMALHLAATRPEVVRGVVCVNAYLTDRRIAGAFLIAPVVRAVKGVGGDIKKAQQEEIAYERIPTRAVVNLARFVKLVRSELPQVRQPLLVFNSPEDHVVPKGTAELIMRRVGSAQKELVELPNSYHVACLDHDAELILERTDAFVRALAPAGL